MNNLPWLQDQMGHWLKLILSEKVPHAILLNSGKGLGKLELAKQMAHTALCEQLTERGVCYQCSACELYKVGNHPDLTLISAEKSVIKVEQIRALSKNIMLTATKNQYRVVIIQDAEQMNKASANALLKTLEEPPNKVIIILTTSEMSRLLPTIKSRCVKINVSLPHKDMTTEWLKTCVKCTETEISLVLTLANNSPLLAKKLIEDNTLEIIKGMLLDLNSIVSNQQSILEISKKWFSEELYSHMHLVSSYFMNLLKYNNKLSDSYFSDYLGFVFNFNHVVDLDVKFLNFIHDIHLFAYRIETSLKNELLIEEMLINWKADFK